MVYYSENSEYYAHLLKDFFGLLGFLTIFALSNTLNLIEAMKRFILTIAAIVAVGSLSAQTPEKTVTEARIEYDRAVAAKKNAIKAAKKEEKRVKKSSKERLNQIRLDLETAKDTYEYALEEVKRLEREAKAEFEAANLIYKQEVTRTKQEVTAAKTNTEAEIQKQKSNIALAKAELARVKALEEIRKKAK